MKELLPVKVFVPVGSNEDYALSEWSLRDEEWKIGTPLKESTMYCLTREQMEELLEDAFVAGGTREAGGTASLQEYIKSLLK